MNYVEQKRNIVVGLTWVNNAMQTISTNKPAQQELPIIARKRNAINLEKYLFICSFLNTFNISSD